MFEPLKAEKAKEALSLSVVKTFEEIAFMDVVETADISMENIYENVFSIDILKPVSGKIFIMLQDWLKDSVIKNIYVNQSGKLKDNEKDDCLLEILNVIAGEFLSRYFGKGSEYKIELPQVYIDYKEGDEKPFVDIFFDAEGLPFRVFLNTIRYRY